MREDLAVKIVNQFLNALKPPTQVKMLVIENCEKSNLTEFFNFSQQQDIFHFHFANKNKASAVNYAISNLIPEEEALIIHIDNDISFSEDFMIKYYEAAIRKGVEYYFGGSFYVNYPKSAEDKLTYLNRSATGVLDMEMKNMKNPMFFGCSYSFFKSQWKKVNGLDERFSPGSKYNLGAEESVFQKKLKYIGYKPFFIENNAVEHHVNVNIYDWKNILKRKKNNGYTHGFQNLIAGERWRNDYFRKLIYNIKRCILLLIQQGNSIEFRIKLAYLKGYFKALFLFFIIDNKRSYLDY